MTAIPLARFRKLHKELNPTAELPDDFSEMEMPNKACTCTGGAVAWELFSASLSRNTTTWMGQDTFLTTAGTMDSIDTKAMGVCRRLILTVTDVKGENLTVQVWAVGTAASTIGISAATALLLQSLAHSTTITGIRLQAPGMVKQLPVDASMLEAVLKNSQALQSLVIGTFVLTAPQMRALASANGVQVALEYCNLTPTSFDLATCLQDNLGPAILYRCELDSVSLAAALPNNTSLRQLTLRSSYGNSAKDRTIIKALAIALKSNKGLETLSLAHCTVSNENCQILCDSLKHHSALKVLDLTKTSKGAAADTVSHLQSLEQILHTNTVLHTIHMDTIVVEGNASISQGVGVWQGQIVSRLERNLYRARVDAIQHAAASKRPTLLAHSVAAVTGSPGVVWMILSQNVDVIAGTLQQPRGVIGNAI